MNEVSAGKWIYVGENLIPAYILKVINPELVSAGYFQNDIKAIKENFEKVDGRWQFQSNSVGGSYLRGSDEAIVKTGPYK